MNRSNALKHLLSLCGFAAVLLFSINSFAQQGPSQLNISGGLFNSAGSPIESSNVRFKIDIYDKNATCLMYTEQHTGVDLSGSRGAFSLIIGAGTSAVNNLEGTTAFDSKIFENPGAVAPFTGCGSGLTLNPGDTRLIRVSYDIGAGLVAMTPDIPITSSAYAMVAETLQGKAPSDFILTNVNTSLSQANVDYIFSNTNYPNLKALVDGTSSQYIVSNPSAAVGFNGQRLTNVGTPTAGGDATNKTYVDSNLGGKTVDVTGVGPGVGGGRTIVWDQTQNKWVTSATGSVGLVAAGAGLNGGNITASGTLSVDVGTTANKILQLDASARIPAVDASLLTNVNAMFLQGRSVSIAAPAAQQVLGWNVSTSQWEPETPTGGTVTGLTGDVSGSGTGVISTTIQPNAVTSAKINNTGVAVNRLLITDATTGATVGYASCALGEVMQWTATGWACKSVTLMLGTSGVTAGTYGNSTQVSQVGVDAQGRVVSLTNVNIAFPVTSVAGRTGAVTLTASDISGLGTAAAQNVGTGANNVLQFSVAGQLPALDGSLLTNLPVVSSQWTTSGANIYRTSGNVGIGTSTPAYALDVSGTMNATSVVVDTNIGVGTASPGSELDLNGALTVRGTAAPALAPSGQGRIYFDSTTKQFTVSTDAGAYHPLVVSGGSGGGLSSTSNLVLNTNTDNAGADGGVTFQNNSSNLFTVDNYGVATHYGTGATTLSTLNGTITSGQTSITVNTTAGLPGAGTLWIDSEAMTYTGTTATTITGITRGALGTTAAGHNNGALINTTNFAVLSSNKPTFVVKGDGSVQTGSCVANGTDSFCLGGTSAVASGTNAIASGASTASGSQSFAGGGYSWANSTYAFAWGDHAGAYGWDSTSIGSVTAAYGTNAIALGKTVTVGVSPGSNGFGNYSMGLGLGAAAGTAPSVTGVSSLGIFLGDQSGTSLTASNTVGIYGGTLVTTDTSPKTASTTGILHTVGNTSATASINKIGMDIESTGAWSGTGATNTGLVVNATGGTTNYAAILNGGFVGIGSSSPAVALDVAGSAVFRGPTTGGVDGELYYNNGTHSYMYYDAGAGSWQSLAAGNVTFTGSAWGPNGSNTYFNTGTVGIGTTSAASELEVVEPVDSASGGLLVTNLENTNSLALWTDSSGGAHVDGGVNGNGTLIFNTGGGKVGIGTATPLQSLDVVGTMSVGGISPGNTTVTVAMTATDTSMTVGSTANFPSSGSLQVEAEIINYTGVTPTTFTGLSRGMYASIATTHATTKPVRSIAFIARGSSATLPLIRVFGDNTLWLGTGSGTSSSASGYVIGGGTATGGNGATAIGRDAQALSDSSVAFSRAVAAGYGAVGMGFANASATGAVAGGFATATSTSSAAFGQYNKQTGTENATSWTGSDVLFSLGNGTGAGAKSNALLVFQNGQTIVSGNTTVTVPAGAASLNAMGTGTTSAAGAFNATDSAGSSKLYVRNDGNVGIGTISPQTSLDVNGGLRAGSSTVVTATCNAANEGIQRYNYTSHTMEFCNGTVWSTVGASATAPYVPTSVVYSATKTAGNAGSYAAMNALCSAGYHMCTANDLVMAKLNNVAVPATSSGWYATGIGYYNSVAWEEDCKAWTSAASSDWGPAWDQNGTTTGDPDNLACNTSTYVMCCK